MELQDAEKTRSRNIVLDMHIIYFKAYLGHFSSFLRRCRGERSGRYDNPLNIIINVVELFRTSRNDNDKKKAKDFINNF